MAITFKLSVSFLDSDIFFIQQIETVTTKQLVLFHFSLCNFVCFSSMIIGNLFWWLLIQFINLLRFAQPQVTVAICPQESQPPETVPHCCVSPHAYHECGCLHRLLHKP